MSVIANTTVISNFAGIGRLDLLRQLYGNLYISAEVYEEIQTGIEEGYRFYATIPQLVHPLAAEGWIQLTGLAHEAELRPFSGLPSRLHRGEASCLAVAHNRGWLLLTDDRAARDEASRLGVRLSGSVGCLVLAVEHGLCTLQQVINGWTR